MNLRLHKRLAAAFGLWLAALSPVFSVNTFGADIGDVQTCVALKSIDDSRIIDDKTIVLRVINAPEYRRIDLATECHGLAFAGSFSSATSIGQLCANDILRVTRDPMGSQCTIDQITVIDEGEAKALIAARKR